MSYTYMVFTLKHAHCHMSFNKTTFGTDKSCLRSKGVTLKAVVLDRTCVVFVLNSVSYKQLNLYAPGLYMFIVLLFPGYLLR